jgi:hypothetical protein
MQFLVPAIKAKEDFCSEIPTVHKGKLKEKKNNIYKRYTTTHTQHTTHTHIFVCKSFLALNVV